MDKYEKIDDIMQQIKITSTIDLDMQLKLADKLITVAEEMDDSKHIAYGYCVRGSVKVFSSFLQEGIDDLDYSYKISSENKYLDVLLLYHSTIATYYVMKDDLHASMENNLQAMDYAMELNNYMFQSGICNNIALLFRKTFDYKSSYEYFLKAHEAILHVEVSDIQKGALSNIILNLMNAVYLLGKDELTYDYLVQLRQIANENKSTAVSAHLLKFGEFFYSLYHGEEEKAVEQAEFLYKQQQSFQNSHYFIQQLTQALLVLDWNKKHELAGRIFSLLESLSEKGDQAGLLEIERTRIAYSKKYNSNDFLGSAYENYFNINENITVSISEQHTSSLRNLMTTFNVKKENFNISEENKILSNLSMIDQLTGIRNRRSFDKMKIKYSNDPNVKYFGIVLIDVDHFKPYNDNYGHLLGDEVLKQIATVLLGLESKGITPFRYGGDEFICVAKNISIKTMRDYCETAINDVIALKIPHSHSDTTDIVTISMGYCIERLDNALNTSDDIMRKADDFLYNAKRKGKNRFVGNV